MATLAVNRCIQVYLGPRRRDLLRYFWAKRDYNSELPVSYAAWKCSRGEKTQRRVPLGRHGKSGSSLFGNGVADGGRVSCSSSSFSCRSPVRSFEDGSLYEVFSLGEETGYDALSDDIEGVLGFEDFSTSEFMYPVKPETFEDSDQSFCKPQMASRNALSEDTPNFEKVKENAKRIAITLLARRSFTTVELGKRLRSKKYPSVVIELVIAELKDRGLLDDVMYAESFSQSRWSSSSWGPKRIRKALLQKGVSEADIQKAANMVFMDDGMSDSPQDMHLGMSKISMERLFVQASKHWLRVQNTPLANRRSRMVRWLQYRGFDWGVTNFIMTKLEAQYPP